MKKLTFILILVAISFIACKKTEVVAPSAKTATTNTVTAQNTSFTGSWSVDSVHITYGNQGTGIYRTEKYDTLTHNPSSAKYLIFLTDSTFEDVEYDNLTNNHHYQITSISVDKYKIILGVPSVDPTNNPAFDFEACAILGVNKITYSNVAGNTYFAHKQ